MELCVTKVILIIIRLSKFWTSELLKILIFTITNSFCNPLLTQTRTTNLKNKLIITNRFLIKDQDHHLHSQVNTKIIWVWKQNNHGLHQGQNLTSHLLPLRLIIRRTQTLKKSKIIVVVNLIFQYKILLVRN